MVQLSLYLQFSSHSTVIMSLSCYCFCIGRQRARAHTHTHTHTRTHARTHARTHTQRYVQVQKATLTLTLSPLHQVSLIPPFPQGNKTPGHNKPHPSMTPLSPASRRVPQHSARHETVPLPTPPLQLPPGLINDPTKNGPSRPAVPSITAGSRQVETNPNKTDPACWGGV